MCPCTPAVAGLEGEVGKLLAAAQAVQQQYSIKPLEQPAAGGKGSGQQQAQQEGDVAMQDAGQTR